MAPAITKSQAHGRHFENFMIQDWAWKPFEVTIMPYFLVNCKLLRLILLADSYLEPNLTAYWNMKKSILFPVCFILWLDMGERKLCCHLERIQQWWWQCQWLTSDDYLSYMEIKILLCLKNKIIQRSHNVLEHVRFIQRDLMLFSLFSPHSLQILVGL